jgi:hypothetical protein
VSPHLAEDALQISFHIVLNDKSASLLRNYLKAIFCCRPVLLPRDIIQSRINRRRGRYGARIDSIGPDVRAFRLRDQLRDLVAKTFELNAFPFNENGFVALIDVPRQTSK